ncbi:uncharacterized protein LOC122302186 [Carya illinoinensis]|uniref:uncharacterized protein LOC122302186 n=1 Tax=Carya illinoinensis TaxID=32201 RepID=UPI001C718D68|nr:uncharacterized protein LOC122302186 [Carya illinoinensis]
MVAGKVRVAMGLQKSPARSAQEMLSKPPLPSPSLGKVQPRPPDVTELLRLVEELRERESLLENELLEYKLLKEFVAIVPVLENEISVKDDELHRVLKRVECLEIENQTLRMKLEGLKTKMDNQRTESEEKVKAMEAEVSELKRTASDRYRVELILDSDELSSSQRFQGRMEVSIKSNLIKNLKKGTKCTESGSIFENQKLEGPNSEKEDTKNERPRHSRCNSEDLTGVLRLPVCADERGVRRSSEITLFLFVIRSEL